MYDKKKIISYINAVCIAACKSENRPIDVEYQFSIFREDIFIFAIKCKYNRVLRRIRYRLYNNFKKNFPDLIMNDVSCPIREWEDGDGNAHIVGFEPEMIDYNYSVAVWSLFGRWGTLSYFMNDPKINPHLENEDGRNRYTYMKDNGFEYMHKQDFGSWLKFCSEYNRIFGEKLTAQPDTIDKVELKNKDITHSVYHYTSNGFLFTKGNGGLTVK